MQNAVLLGHLAEHLAGAWQVGRGDRGETERPPPLETRMEDVVHEQPGIACRQPRLVLGFLAQAEHPAGEVLEGALQIGLHGGHAVAVPDEGGGLPDALTRSTSEPPRP